METILVEARRMTRYTIKSMDGSHIIDTARTPEQLESRTWWRAEGSFFVEEATEVFS